MASASATSFSDSAMMESASTSRPAGTMYMPERNATNFSANSLRTCPRTDSGRLTNQSGAMLNRPPFGAVPSSVASK